MNEQVKINIENYPTAIVDKFMALRQLIFDCSNSQVEETLWAKMPTYKVKESLVRLIPFKDHINVEAQGIFNYKHQ